MRDLPRRTITAAVYAAVVLVAAFAPPIVFAAVLVITGVLAFTELVTLRRAGIAVLIEGALLVVGGVSLYFLRALGEPPTPLVITIVAVWAADVIAYAVGSAFGTRKIAPTISPGKTWEGTIAGFIAAGLTAILIASVDVLPSGVAFAILVGPVALGGDLLESWVKRRAGVKDSGTLLPGHGGMLDRIDSLLAVSILGFALYAPGCCMAALG